MVEILRRGAPDAPREFDIECYHCDSALRFKRHEAVLRGSRDGDYFEIECPVCRGVIRMAAR